MIDALLALLLQLGLFVLTSLAIILCIIWVRVPVRRKKNGRAERTTNHE